MMILRILPKLSFFIAAAIFEQITIEVPNCIVEDNEIRKIMQLHAAEEKSHIAIDSQIITQSLAECSPLSRLGKILLCLMFLWYVDRRVSKAWKSAVKRFCENEDLPNQTRQLILKRGMSQSDYLGIKSFLKLDLLKEFKSCWILPKILSYKISSFEKRAIRA